VGWDCNTAAVAEAMRRFPPTAEATLAEVTPAAVTQGMPTLRKAMPAELQIRAGSFVDRKGEHHRFPYAAG
jgi:hypothetical protein